MREKTCLFFKCDNVNLGCANNKEGEMIRKNWLCLALVPVCILGLAVVGCAKPTAPPAKVITLVHESVYPATHRISVQDRWWQEEVEKASNGRIKFEYHPGGEPVVKAEALRGLSKGTIDVLTSASTYYSGDCAIADFMLGPKNFKTYEDLFDLCYGEVGNIIVSWLQDVFTD